MESAGNNVDGRGKGSIEKEGESMRQKINFKLGNERGCAQHLG